MINSSIVVKKLYNFRIRFNIKKITNIKKIRFIMGEIISERY